MTWPSEVPESVQAKGMTQGSVVPGVIAVSRTTKEPSGETMKSQRETSESPRTRCASQAVRRSSSRTSSGKPGFSSETNSAV